MVRDRVADEVVDDNFVKKTGDTISGDILLLNANLLVSPGFLVDGVDVSALASSVGTMATDVTSLSGAVSTLTAEVTNLNAEVDGKLALTGGTLTGDLSVAGTSSSSGSSTGSASGGEGLLST